MRQLPSLGEDGDRGVSPVIGVILMVAITVILAAVIASFVLGLGDSTGDAAPNVNFQGSFDSNSGTNDTFTLSVGTTDGNGDAGDFEFVVSGDEEGSETLENIDGFSGTISAGDSATFNASSTNGLTDTPPEINNNNTEIQVIFRGDNEQVFDTFEIPDDWSDS